MKIVFRVNYRTEPGQDIAVRLAVSTENGLFEFVLPLRWLNEVQWEGEIEFPGTPRIEYRYVFRQPANGVDLEEWGGPRVIDRAVPAYEAVDTWCSAGGVDYAFESKALEAALPNRSLPFGGTGPGNCEFRLSMAALPDGVAVCLLGGLPELGGWDPARAPVLVETARNVWSVAIDLPAAGDIGYKYGLLDLATGTLAHLEEGENRWITRRSLAAGGHTRVSDEAYRRPSSALFRGAGVAVPVFSLRSAEGLGVGEFADLKRLADWAGATGLKLIQILPINDTTSSHQWTDSYPYSAISVFALHPIYLRVADLGYAMGEDFKERLGASARRLNALSRIDYVAVMEAKLGFLREIFAYHRRDIVGDPEFGAFARANHAWVIPYAVFCAKRDEYGTADFTRWGDSWAEFDWVRIEALVREDWPTLSFHVWLQFELDRQLADAVEYLHEHDIALKGDLPIGIDRESVDAWSAPHLYKMEAQTGAPPDAFAIKGQNWGFPTYDWEVMRRDGYAWWRNRFAVLSRYFDAYRIDHILGFFRIWQVPIEHVDGIMGWFDPALPIPLEEFSRRGIAFDRARFCLPYLDEESLAERFGADAERVKENFLEPRGGGLWRLRDEVDGQRKILEHPAAAEFERVREALMDCVSDVLFFSVPGSEGTLFHPRCGMQLTRSYKALPPEQKQRVEELYNDYFYVRQEAFWQARGFEKLPAMRKASRMLLCGEDLGMVPGCVPGVLRETGILSLEIQRMPKVYGSAFFNPVHAPYMSVVSPSTHDMQTLREWWEEDARTRADFAREMFGMNDAPAEMSGEIAGRIIRQHLESPAMWAIFPLQDLLAMDEHLRLPDAKAERINVPAIMPYYWRYRMHLDLAELTAAAPLNDRLREMVAASGR